MFATHKALRRYRKLNCGTCSACEIFQHTIHEQIRDIPNVLNISDDVIAFGTTQAEHDHTLRAVFLCFSDKGLTLDREKCEYNQDQLNFFGFVFSGDGISHDPLKVEAIKHAPPPSTDKDVRSFIGLGTYCSKFIHNFSDLSQPLRELTKKNMPFKWTSEHQKSFQAVKSALTSTTVMAYFDKGKLPSLLLMHLLPDCQLFSPKRHQAKMTEK